MDCARVLLLSGMFLLSFSALMGFVQHRHRERPEQPAHWRAVRAGGTAGAVQLIALSALGDHFATKGGWVAFLVAGVVLATWAFFLGPLARALGRPRTASVINGVGAVVALPSYLALPMLVL